MICFKDRTFCASDCVNKYCFRHFGDDDKYASRLWWSHDPDNAPVAFADFSKDCEGYRKE